MTCSLRKQYGRNLENALPLIIAGNVTCLETPSVDGVEPRRVYRVKAEKSQDVYTVLPHLYCTCESFQNILRRGDDVCVRCFYLLSWLLHTWQMSHVMVLRMPVLTGRCDAVQAPGHCASMGSPGALREAGGV